MSSDMIYFYFLSQKQVAVSIARHLIALEIQISDNRVRQHGDCGIEMGHACGKLN